jgi:hypothetical protein
MFCLPQKFAEKLKQAIRSGEFSPEKMNSMKSSQEARSYLAKFVGEENAREVNLLFEKKLLLKNQEKAMYDWAKEVTGLSKADKEATLEKIKQTYAEKQRRIYNPAEDEMTLNEITSDVYSRKYKTEVSLEQAQTITDLAQDAKEARDKMNPDFTWKSREDGSDFGAKRRALENYTNGLRLQAIKSGFVSPFGEVGVYGKIGALIENFKVSVNFIAENSRAIVASVDDSLWGRQGLRVLFDPRYSSIWVKDFVKSWKDIYSTMKAKNAIKAGDAIKDAVISESYSRQNSLNGRYEGKVGVGPRGTRLDIGTGEEAYPTSFPSKILVLGRFFKGSEVAYEVGAMRLRMDIADRVYAWAEKAGYDMTDNKTIGDLNEVVNGMTGRGTFGAKAGGFERTTNKVFFAIKFFKSNFDYLTLHQGRLSTPATKLAATNLLYTVVTTGLILGLAKALNPDDNKDIFNRTSSNFGKIRYGNMTVDLTHGAGGIVVAASKIIEQKSTSATTGITKKLGEGYGAQTRMDVFWSFTENKFSPMFGVIRDLVKQQTFGGGKPTLFGEMGALTTPISIQNISQFKDESAGMQLIGLIADGLGFNVNVFVPSTDWGESAGVELQKFHQKVGDAKFKEANDLFNKKVGEWLNSVKINPRFSTLSDEQKQNVITNKKAEIKRNIFKQYGFIYVSPPKKITPKF